MKTPTTKLLPPFLAVITLIIEATTIQAAPYYSCYDTYTQLTQRLQRWRNQYPNLVEIIDIGDSWEKQSQGSNHDLWVIKVTNQNITASKPAVFYIGEHHARELASSQVLIDFIENELLAKYNNDPVITNLLNTRELHLLPMANPDGHLKAENGENWRKNTNNSNGTCPGPPPNSYGTDLNRNYSKAFGGVGASSNPCHATYRGISAFSEPETQAIRDYIDKLRPRIVISYHSFGNLILYPWGYTTQATQHAQQFSQLAQRLSALTATNTSPSTYQFGQTSRILYQAAGDTTDWFYDKYQLPAFTFELGSSFWPTCQAYRIIYEKNVQPMIYAAQIANDPWKGSPTPSPTPQPPILSPTPTITITPPPTPIPSPTPKVSPTPPVPSADVNEDGQVNQNDIQILLDNWSLPAPFLYPKADLNHDNFINALDASKVFNQWSR